MNCINCGGTGELADGRLCDCQFDHKPLIDLQNNNFIPKRYLGVGLVDILIKPVTISYPLDLITLQDNILNIGKLTTNQYLYSPAQCRCEENKAQKVV